MGVPCKLGAEGIEQVIEVELTDAEKAELGRAPMRFASSSECSATSRPSV